MTSQHVVILYGSLQQSGSKIVTSNPTHHTHNFWRTNHLQQDIMITTYKALARWPLSHTNGKHSMHLVFCNITPCTAWKLATFTYKAAVITSAYSVIPQKTLVTMWQLQITHVPQTEEMLLAVNVFYAMERRLHSFTTNDERKQFWWITKFKSTRSHTLSIIMPQVWSKRMSHTDYIFTKKQTRSTTKKRWKYLWRSVLQNPLTSISHSTGNNYDYHARGTAKLVHGFCNRQPLESRKFTVSYLQDEFRSQKIQKT